MVPMTTVPHLKPLMMLIPARWGFEGAIVPQRNALQDDPAWIIDLGRKETSPTDFIEAGKFKCAVAQMASDTFAGGWSFTHYEMTWLPFAVMGGSTLVLLVLLCVILKRRDPV